MKPKIKGKPEKFQYGNYPRYYGYRVKDKKPSEDPRLEIIKEEYINDKNILDIGCNSGLFTIELAKRFHPKLITAVDLDQKLIILARKNLKRQKERLENVYFRTEDFLASGDAPNDQFDTVLALSITKWIHLNWGDEGIKLLFTKIKKVLKPNGCLILEAQPWSSYKRRKNITSRTRNMYVNSKLRPEMFRELLQNEFGFLYEGEQTVSEGFRRPLRFFRKQNECLTSFEIN